MTGSRRKQFLLLSVRACGINATVPLLSKRSLINLGGRAGFGETDPRAPT